MKPIAVINGKEVYSDKRMAGIVNTRITFTDGSWCDVATGDVVNQGVGFINIGAPSSAATLKTTIGPQRYTATTLMVQGVEANINIQPITGTEMVVTLEGPKSAVESVVVCVRGSTLVVESKGEGGTHIRGANIIVGGTRGNIVIGGSSISIGNAIIGSSSPVSDIKIRIGVPKGSEIKISGVQGDVTIGDTDGRLQASVMGGDSITAGQVRDSVLSLQGSGNIEVAAVNGNLGMTIQGSGDILVRNGSVPLLNINVMGSGDARFSGAATDANLSVMGSGDIMVASVQNRPTTNIMGRGDIKIGNW